MVSAALIVSAIALSIITIVCTVLLVIQFGHPDDKNVALFPKFIVITGFFLTFSMVLCLPFDVANARGSGGGLRADVLWQILFVFLAIWVLVVLPYAFWFYESDNDPNQGIMLSCAGQAGTALRYTIIGFVVAALIMGISFIFLNEAEIPVHRIRRDFDSLPTTFDNDGVCGDNCEESEITWSIPVSFVIYAVAVLSFIGWFLFTIFVGVGLVALPVDLINEWRTRPTPMTASEYAKRKIHIGKRATELLKIANEYQRDVQDLDRKQNRKSRKQDREIQNRLEAEVYALKNEYRYLEEAYFQKGGNPIWYFSKLMAGCIGCLVSLTWILHICIYLLPSDPPTIFLNRMFIDLEEAISGFSLFGVLAFGIYSFYLLWCTAKGTFRVGLRIPLLCKIYPMEFQNTMMNAFIFNVLIILICTIPVVQFCTISFDVYARHTEADLIFGAQVQYLKFFKYFWENYVFVYGILLFNLLTLIMLIISPRDVGKEIDRNLKAIVKGER